METREDIIKQIDEYQDKIYALRQKLNNHHDGFTDDDLALINEQLAEKVFYFDAYEEGSFFVKFREARYRQREFCITGDFLHLSTEDGLRCIDGLYFEECDTLEFEKFPGLTEMRLGKNGNHASAQEFVDYMLSKEVDKQNVMERLTEYAEYAVNRVNCMFFTKKS